MIFTSACASLWSWLMYTPKKNFVFLIIKNWMIRGLNSIHEQALLPQNDRDKKSFAGYALCLTEFTHHHHAGVTQSVVDP